MMPVVALMVLPFPVNAEDFITITIGKELHEYSSALHRRAATHMGGLFKFGE
jgi:hypothetical protein